jgi:hypothetical protein
MPHHAFIGKIFCNFGHTLGPFLVQYNLQLLLCIVADSNFSTVHADPV